MDAHTDSKLYVRSSKLTLGSLIIDLEWRNVSAFQPI